MLEAEGAELRERIARLERTVSRNSGNSSMPPSGDDLPGRKPPRKQRRAAERQAGKQRKRGKQPGAPGSAMSLAEPDDTRDHFPAAARQLRCRFTNSNDCPDSGWNGCVTRTGLKGF